jgi:two-component system CheB/CheR fusion protein
VATSRSPDDRTAEPGEPGENPDDDRSLDEVLTLLQTVGVDAADYRRTSLRRRVLARMREVGATTVAQYLAVLEAQPDELRRFADGLFVKHTRFFRDEAVFRALEETVLPELARTSPAPLRVWAIGVATGEEAYSVAMLLAAARERTGRPFEVLASEPDPAGLEVARAGVYRAEALTDVPVHLHRLLEPAGPVTLRPVRAVRDAVTFVEHDLRAPVLAPREAVVASFDLVLCRNVLMYLDDRYRTLAVRRLGEVVRAGGALVIGVPESLPAEARGDFAPFPGVDPALRIHARTAARPERP